jgi:putative flippase GtrA
LRNSKLLRLTERYLTIERLRELWAYYKVAVINTIFGLSLYYLLIFIGLNLFIAQFIGTCIGVLFNYYTFSRHVFKETKPSRVRYIMAYAFNYALSVPSLFVWHKIVGSAYVAGLCSTIFVSLINFFVLKFLVFHGREA